VRKGQRSIDGDHARAPRVDPVNEESITPKSPRSDESLSEPERHFEEEFGRGGAAARTRGQPGEIDPDDRVHMPSLWRM
jgi:hypothetical protein